MFASGQKKEERREIKPGATLRAGRSGAPRQEWIRQAVLELLQEEGAERVGVWLAGGKVGENHAYSPENPFTGEVADQNGVATPREWWQFSPIAPLPEEVLSCRGSVEVTAKKTPFAMGPTAELHLALWVPVQRQGLLCGLILVGRRGSAKPIPEGPANRMAEALGLLLEERFAEQSAREHKADLELYKKVQRFLRERQSSATVLSWLAASLTQGTTDPAKGEASLAIFSLIVEKRLRVSSTRMAAPDYFTFVHAYGGDAAWAHSIERGPLEKIWQEVLQTGKLADTGAALRDFSQLPLTKNISQFVALPLYWNGETRGALIAGLPKGRASQNVLERLEIRALLAAQVLELGSHRLSPEIPEKEYAVIDSGELARDERTLSAKEWNAELQQTLDWLEEGVIVFDEGEKIRVFNIRFLQILGLTKEQGHKLHALPDILRHVAHNAADPESFAARWKTLAEEVDKRGQEELVLDWPVPQVIERFAKRLVGENGRPLGRVEVYRDATARKNFLSRMAQAEKLAALGQQVTGIVHELSNPLTTILGNARRILLRAEASGSLTEAQQIREEAERAAGILRQLLRLSADVRPDRSLVSLNDLLNRTLPLQAAAFATARIRLQVDQQASLPRLEGDFNQLQQVLLNLLQNAQQAIEQSGVGGLIGVRTSITHDGRVQLEVWDDGPGIPAANQARIFDPFFTTKAPGLGTGLGLPIVLGFVKQNGGTVVALSPPKGGSRFVVEFPAATEVRRSHEDRVSLLAERVRVEPTAPPGMVGGDFSRRVLVIEDEPTVGRLIADVLRDEGMQVEVLQDGQTALHRVEKYAYDMAICDLKMPGMDGQSFFQALVNRNNPLRLRLLFVTGDLISPRTQEFLERYKLPYVAKPFRMEELSGAVHQLLQKSSDVAIPQRLTAGNQVLGNG